MDICYYYNKNLSNENKEVNMSVYDNYSEANDDNQNPKFDDDILGDDDIEYNNYPDYLYEEAGY